MSIPAARRDHGASSRLLDSREDKGFYRSTLVPYILLRPQGHGPGPDAACDRLHPDPVNLTTGEVVGTPREVYKTSCV